MPNAGQHFTCSQSSIFVGSKSVNSTNHGPKIFRKKKFQKVPKSKT